MLIAFPHCSYKCEKESGVVCCENSGLASSPDIIVNQKYIVDRYMAEPKSQAFVFGGLEPFDSWIDLYDLVKEIRKAIFDDIVIFTGYYRGEILDKIIVLSRFKNIIVKFGRYIPNSHKKYDELLGITLSSDNQYAERISKEYKE